MSKKEEVAEVLAALRANVDVQRSAEITDLLDQLEELVS